nr:Chain A, marinostatin [Alteromonas sp. B-10-31]
FATMRYPSDSDE